MAERILICGGRDFADHDLFRRTMAPFIGRAAIIIHGGARGADQMGAGWAEMFRVPCKAFPADWEKHGRGAGPIRNEQMLREGRPTLVIAFPGGRGTADMLRRAEGAGVMIMKASRAAAKESP